MPHESYKFHVLLGGDYAGKSAAMAALRDQVDWTLVSSDDSDLKPPYTVLEAMRRLFVTSVLPDLDGLHSPDFILSGLQMSLIYLRDQSMAERASCNVLVDSYYYKILAKCILAGFRSDEIFRFWRSFPKPDRVIYLRTSAETAWRRAELAGRLNRFEHYGKEPSRNGFVDFQRDLGSVMLGELGSVPVDFIDGEQEPEAVQREIDDLLMARPPVSETIRRPNGQSERSRSAPSLGRERAIPKIA